MITVRCRECNREVSSVSSQSKSCGCPNMVTVKGDTVTAVDLNRTVMVSSNNDNTKSGLSSQDLQWQEERRKRKVRRIDFETR